jgi:hypothetical protein
MGGNTIEPGKGLTKDENILTAWILYEINWLIMSIKILFPMKSCVQNGGY